MLTRVNLEHILKACHKIADHSMINQKSEKVDVFLVIAAMCTEINTALRINMYNPLSSSALPTGFLTTASSHSPSMASGTP
jgi:hypothetical protein